MTRGERGGDYRGKGRRVCQNNYKGHMDNNGAVEWEGGGEGWGVGLGWGKMTENYT